MPDLQHGFSERVKHGMDIALEGVKVTICGLLLTGFTEGDYLTIDPRPVCPTCGDGLFEGEYPAHEGHYCRECKRWYQMLTKRQRLRLRRARFRFKMWFAKRLRSKVKPIMIRSTPCD